MEHYYLNYKDNICIGSSRARLINDEIECREVTKEEYDAFEQEKQAQFDRVTNLQNQIQELKQQLQKYKEDVEQVELFSMERDDYEDKKELCKNIILELRELEKELRGNGG